MKQRFNLFNPPTTRALIGSTSVVDTTVRGRSKRSSFLNPHSLILLFSLFLGLGFSSQVWAWHECYYVDGTVGWESTSYAMGTSSSGVGSHFHYMTDGYYFKFRIDGKPVGESSTKTLTAGGDGVRLYRWENNDPSAAKYSGDPKIIEVHVDQSTGNNDYNPWVWLTAPKIVVKYSTSWSTEHDLTYDNGLYTATVTSYNGGGCNVGPSGTGSGTMKYISSPTINGTIVSRSLNLTF